jgi:hypothetical protein
LTISPAAILQRPTFLGDCARFAKAKANADTILDINSGNPHWCAYCPNAQTLTALREEERAQPRKREKS